MKKIALTSLLAVFAVSAASAGNVISNNPFYRPSENHFYSVTSLGTSAGYDNEAASDYRLWNLGEEFGYGITDKLSVYLNNSISANYPQTSSMSDDEYTWDNFGLAISYRGIDQETAKMDVYGGVKQLYGWNSQTGGALETNAYLWTVGTKVGVVMKDWTLAGIAEYNYYSDDVDSSDFDFSIWKIGMQSQYVLSDNWNATAGLIYNYVAADDAIISFADFVYGDETFDAELGLNYNIDSTKFVGLYGTKTFHTDYSKDAYGMGVKFGMDF